MKTIGQIIDDIRRSSARIEGSAVSMPLLNAQIIEALVAIDRRLRVLEPCSGEPHRWVPVKADGTVLCRDEPLSLAVGNRCARCDLMDPHGDP